MNNLTDYIVQEDGKFYVDVWDVDTGEPVFEQGEVFSFVYSGVSYKGMAESDGEDEMAEVLLVKE